MVNRLHKPFLAVPELTLGNEDVLAVRPDKDIGFSGRVERLAGGLSLVTES